MYRLVVLGLLIPVGYFITYDVAGVEYIISKRGEACLRIRTESSVPVSGNRFWPHVGCYRGAHLFHQKPPWRAGIRDYGAEASAIMLIVIGIWAGSGKLSATEETRANPYNAYSGTVITDEETDET